MAVITDYWNVFNIFVNELFGSLPLYIVVGVLVLLIIATQFGIPYRAVILIIMLFLMGIVIYTSNLLLWIFMLLFASLTFGINIAKQLQRSG